MNTHTELIHTLSPEETAAIEAQIAHLPDRQSAAIEALQIVQQARGWVSDESLKATARLLDMSPAALDSIATFYNLIFRQPVGRHVVMVCDSVSCYVMGGEALAGAVKTHLGIDMGETTADDRFTLLPIVCLGACDRAPLMMIDDQLVSGPELADLTNVFERFA
ncbi:MAG: NADH-quinone oxidoreductase subunit NuoE [Proteobacteria bacterium]|nr:NADH-quinone oxidoreductase subunit NuoE [Pseudomonadota bacterium]